MSKLIPPASDLFHQEIDLIKLRLGDNVGDKIATSIYEHAEKIAHNTVSRPPIAQSSLDNTLDNFLTSRLYGYPIMLVLLSAIFWITIVGANIPSEILGSILFGFQDQLTVWFHEASAPAWLHGVLVLGMYRSLAWVVSVMLPPMAIFFPLFTLLEDSGYLPRVAFNLDNMFRKCRACGKQILTMCMGFGCNAAGVVACRIIDSPRERLIAIITNNFVPCNGRFPTLIAITTIFIAGSFSPELETPIAALTITALVLLGVGITFLVSWGLSLTILKGEASSMIIELPPYRKPLIGSVIYRSMLERTFFVLKRAVYMAAPAGAITWILANTYFGDVSVLMFLANFLNPFAQSIGLDGVILLAFILGLPANEIVVPIILMSYLATGQLIEVNTIEELRTILIANGWTWLTGLNTLLFCLLHWPCTTTLLSAYKESGSLRWTLVTFLVPTLIGLMVCFFVTQTVRLLGLI